MTTHVGVDAETKWIHSVAASGGNVHDSQKLGELVPGDETEMWGESAYTSHGETKVEKARGGGESTNENARGTIHGKNSNGRATV